jgi:hypothetical protein
LYYLRFVTVKVLVLPCFDDPIITFLYFCFVKMVNSISIELMVISPTVHQNSTCYAADSVGPALKTENTHHQVGSCLPNAFPNGGSSLHTSMQNAVKLSAHANRIDVPPNMLSSQSSNMGINGGIIKSEVGYSGSSYMFGADGSILETRPNIGDASVAAFNSVESNSQPLNESLLDSDTSSFGFLGQIPRNFSLSDLTADFSQSSGLKTRSRPV